MKQLKRSLFTITCAALVLSSVSVAASATGSDGGSSWAQKDLHICKNSSYQRMEANTPYTLTSILQKLRQTQNGQCSRPTVDCPIERPGTNCPEFPGKPEIPNIPEIPNVPDAPEIPDAPDVEQPESGSTAAYTAEVARLVNRERAAEGLSPLTVNVKVQSAAQTRANEQKISFSHTRPNGSSFSTALTEAGVNYRGAGENIAYGQRSPAEVMNGWMNSSGHRANIMNSKFTEIGVGCHKDSSGTLYWAQLFAY